MARDGANPALIAPRLDGGMRLGPYEVAYPISRGYEAERIIIRP